MEKKNVFMLITKIWWFELFLFIDTIKYEKKHFLKRFLGQFQNVDSFGCGTEPFIKSENRDAIITRTFDQKEGVCVRSIYSLLRDYF